MSQNIVPKDEFRDHIGTVNLDGKRNWIYPIKPKGKYYNARNLLTVFCLIVLFGIPFIKMDGHPFILFNVLERKFILFGQIFWPQDFIIFALAMITLVIFISLFTVAFGRIFCGWICPQTVFMELVFRKIEYWFEGDAMKQKKLTKSNWNTNKILRRGGKNVIFWIISFIIANVFLAYIISMDEVLKLVQEPIGANVGSLVSLMIFATIFFFVFAWFREQVCIMVCPYGRLQGVLLDKDSIVVAYDHKRGEDRAILRKKEERTAGDCIDCKQCVQVCPTGIDIRNGTQLECVNCTACIDVCDNIMDKVGFDKGLIRYAYLLLGLISTLFGKGLLLIIPSQILSMAIGVLILLGLVGNHFFKSKLSKFQPLVKTRNYLIKQKNAFIFGVGNGLIPCGLVYTALGLAMLYQNTGSSMLFMLGFGLGTFPATMAIQFAGTKLNLKKFLKPQLSKVIIAFMAIIFIIRGLNLGIPYLSPKMVSEKGKTELNCCEQ